MNIFPVSCFAAQDMSNYLKPVAAVLVPNIGGFIGNVFNKDAFKSKEPGKVAWYEVFNK